MRPNVGMSGWQIGSFGVGLQRENPRATKDNIVTKEHYRFRVFQTFFLTLPQGHKHGVITGKNLGNPLRTHVRSKARGALPRVVSLHNFRTFGSFEELDQREQTEPNTGQQTYFAR